MDVPGGSSNFRSQNVLGERLEGVGSPNVTPATSKAKHSIGLLTK